MIIKSINKEIISRTVPGSLPDVDSDFPGEDRPRVKEYMEKRFGATQVCSLGTYTTFQLKAAITDLARYAKIPIPIVRRMTAKLGDEGEKTVEDLFKTICQDDELREFAKSNVELFNDAFVILGNPKAASIHACGTVIFPDEKATYQWAPMREQKELVVTEWEGSEIEEAGFLKEDILGIEQLDKLSDMLKLIKKHHGIEIDLYKDVPLDDPEVFRYVEKGYLGDVFHFGAKGLSSYCVQMRPNSLEELSACAALYRPGPIENNIHNEYILRKEGEKEVTYPIGAEEVLKQDFGLMVYQESIMRLCQRLAGFDLEETDSVRKALGKKKMDKIKAYGEKFIKGYVERFGDQGVDEKYAEDLWKQMSEFAKYAFNKSHSVAYARNGYNCLWLKVHYPLEFWSVTFSRAELKDFPFYINEIQSSGGIKVLPVDINLSEINIVSDQQTNNMYWALNSVMQVGEKAQEWIMNERKTNGPFFSLDEFIDRCVEKGSPVNKSVIENLIYAGAFDNLEKLEKPSERLRLLEQYRENRKVKVVLEKDLLTNVIQAKKDKNEWWWQLQQKRISGFAFFDYESLLKQYLEPKLDHYVWFMEAAALRNWEEGCNQEIMMGGYVLEVQERKSKKGYFANLVLESNYEFIKVMVFPELYEEFRDYLKESQGNLLLLNGYPQWNKFHNCYVLQTTISTNLVTLT
jgi:DNA polymerase-3 subunit alpha